MSVTRFALTIFAVAFVAGAVPGLAYYVVMRLRHPEWWRL